jgi:hypothetical protein
VLLATGYKYAFTILRETAHGRLDPPGGVLEAPDSVVIKFLALYVVLIFAVVVIAFLASPAAAIIAAIAFTLALPAATMALAMDESLASALNPATWLAIIGRLGGAYFLLFALLFVFQLSAANATGLAGQFLPPVVSDIVFSAIFFWGLFGTFHLMGYLLYQYHERFGFEPEAHEHAAQRPESRDDVLLADSEALIRDGQVEQATALLGGEIDRRAVPLEVHERYRRLLRQQVTPERLQQHGALFLNVLMLEGEHRRALALARECLDLDARFAPLLPEQGLELAQRAHALGQSRLAIDLLASMRLAFPKDRGRAHWALMEADLLLQRGDGDAQAREALSGARERCDDPNQQRKLDALLAAVPG